MVTSPRAKPPTQVPSPAKDAAIGLVRTADLLRRLFAAVIEPHGITLQQFNVLRILRGAGPQGLPTLSIMDRMIEKAPGITRLIDRLEAQGLVVRNPCREDRRRIFCQITPEGLALLARLERPVHLMDEKAVSGLSAREQRQLVGLLDRIRAAHGEP